MMGFADGFDHCIWIDWAMDEDPGVAFFNEEVDNFLFVMFPEGVENI